jgi:hypothetical protein
MNSDMTLATQNLVLITRAMPMGAMPMIHRRRPSSENCGNTNRVVTEARFSEQMPEVQKATRLTQNGLVSWWVKLRRLMI